MTREFLDLTQSGPVPRRPVGNHPSRVRAAGVDHDRPGDGNGFSALFTRLASADATVAMQSGTTAPRQEPPASASADGTEQDIAHFAGAPDVGDPETQTGAALQSATPAGFNGVNRDCAPHDKGSDADTDEGTEVSDPYTRNADETAISPALAQIGNARVMGSLLISNTETGPQDAAGHGEHSHPGADTPLVPGPSLQQSLASVVSGRFDRPSTEPIRGQSPAAEGRAKAQPLTVTSAPIERDASTHPNDGSQTYLNRASVPSTTPAQGPDSPADDPVSAGILHIRATSAEAPQRRVEHPSESLMQTGAVQKSPGGTQGLNGADGSPPAAPPAGASESMAIHISTGTVAPTPGPSEVSQTDAAEPKPVALRDAAPMVDDQKTRLRIADHGHGDSAILYHPPQSQPAHPLSPDRASIGSAAVHPIDPGDGMPVDIARQLHANSGNRVEITLAPSELGKVRMTLHMSDSGVTVSISTERPETLDLMRHNISRLAGDLRALGYDDVGFSFAGNGDHDARSGPAPSFPSTEDRDGPPLPDTPHRLAGAVPVQQPGPHGPGLDLRL